MSELAYWCILPESIQWTIIITSKLLVVQYNGVAGVAAAMEELSQWRRFCAAVLCIYECEEVEHASRGE